MAQDLYQAAGVQPQVPAPAGPVDLYHAMQNTSVRSRDNPLMQGGGEVGAPVMDFLHHATGGLTDKEIAALQAAGIMGGGVEAGGFSDRYHGSLQNLRSNLAEWEGDSPKTAKAAKVAGVVAPMAAAGPAVLEKSMGQAALQSGKAGAGFGGAFGFGGTDDESLGQDLTATGVGAAAGGAAGLALPYGLGIAKAPFRMARNATSVFGKEGAEVAAGRVLNESKTNGDVFEHAPLPDMKLTTGQTTNDPGLLWLERNVSQASPRGATLTGEAMAKNNSAIRGGISQLGPADSADPSKAMSDALDRVYAARKKANGEIWRKADVSNTGGISGFQFNNFMKKHVEGLPIPDQDIVPKDVMATIEKMGQAKTQNLSDVQAIRSRLGSMATMAARQGDGNTARVLGNLADKTEEFIDMKAANLGEKLPLYNEARAHTKSMKETFNQPPAVRTALGADSYGADKVPVSATADHFIKTGKGAKETWSSYLNAIAEKDAKTGKITYDPDGLKAAQDAFAQKFLKQVSNSGVDADGQNLVSPAKMQKFLGDYSHVINSPAFTPEQRELVSRIAKASQMASRTANARPPGGGSDTFQKLQGDKFIDALVGPGASKLVGAVGKVGGAAWGAVEEGKIGAVMGFVAGEKGGELVNSLYKAPRDKVVALITEAMHDPQLAKDLMMKASNTNAKLLPPPRRAKIFGVLGAQTAQPAVKAITGN